MPVPNLSDPFKTRGLTALLGPTNTGKTHFAIQRMLGHKSGLIGLPLRLLAREVYQRILAQTGPEAVALITGEEKIKPANPRYWVSTVEAMPRDLETAFVAVDEIQLAADTDRGHVFTDALLNRRGTEETVLIGSSTMRPLIEELFPSANIVTRPRLSKLTFAGERKLTRLPARSAIVAFSAEEVYAVAELLRRERGGAAVVLGALSPRTRNAQVALFQSGEVDLIVATDAIGMGLNLEVDHVAFAADRKFDGANHRKLTAAEMGQIAGRAGRHLRDGTFGTTGRCPALDEDMVEALEEHRFDPVRLIYWRNPDLDFASIEALQASLGIVPTVPGLIRARAAEDEVTLELLSQRPLIRQLAAARGGVTRLWDVCKLPDYRKVVPHNHADLVQSIYEPLMRQGHIPASWFAAEVAACDRTDGDISTLSARIAHIRTWTYCANRSDWLEHPVHWQNATRAIEDKLSDALHEKLAQRFIDRRTSVLMRRLRENTMLEAEITDSGDVLVESQHLGRLEGFRFTADASAEGPEAKALKSVAARALAGEIDRRAKRLAESPDNAFALSLDGTLRWIGAPVAKIQSGEKFLEPRVLLLADEQLSGPPRQQVEERLQLWLKAHITKHLGPLIALESGEGMTGAARGIGYQVAENFGVLDRARVADVIKGLDQQQRAELRALGIRFGAHHIYTAGLMKPAPRALAAQLYALRHEPDATGVSDVSHLAASGRTSIPVDKSISKDLYRVAGFRVTGERAIRVDILERLADLIRPALAWREGSLGTPPAGAFPGGGFTVTGAMTSLVGSSGEDFASILIALGYRQEMKPAASFAPAATEAPASDAAEAAAEAQETAPETIEEIAVEPVADTSETVEQAPPDAIAAQEDVPVATEAPAPAEPDAAPAAAEPAAAAEPEMVAVWRPGRPDHARRHHHRPHQRRQETPGEAAGEGRPAGEARGDRYRHDRSRRPEGAAAGERPVGPRSDRGPRQDQPRQDQPRQDQPRRDQPRGDQRQGDRPDRRDGERKFGDKPFRGKPRGDRPHGKDRGDRPERERSWQSAPPPAKGPDPDSPFAKLAALKAQLDKK
jgi:ATP-dependent RNA helicase SUPV3L1/SUV3